MADLTVVSDSPSLSCERLTAAFAEFLDLDVGAGDASDDTLHTYVTQIRQYLKWCQMAGVNPATATRQDIKTYRRWMVEEKGFKPATIALKLTTVRRFYTAAVEQGLLLTNPASGIKPPREKRDREEQITYLDRAELKAFLATIPDDGSLKSQRDLALVKIMALEGPRQIEMHRANVGDLVERGKNLGVRVEGKRNIRVLPLTPALAETLRSYLRTREVIGEVLTSESPLFIATGYYSGGQRLSRTGIRRIVDRYLKACNLKHNPGRTLTTHSLRHTVGTLALRSGADLRQVQDLLGHADPRTTTIYTRVADRWDNNPGLMLELD